MHVRYGLPQRLEAEEGAEEEEILESDSVEGILARVHRDRELDDRCSVEDWVSLSSSEIPGVDGILRARRRLDELRQKRRVRDGQAEIDEGEADAVETFDAEVEAWAQACAPLLNATSGESSGPSRASGYAIEVPCQSSDDCFEANAPICGDDDVCVGCDEVAGSDDACAALDPMRPVCERASCVECAATADERCREQSLVCDQVINQCVSCVEHEQCGDAACDLFAGRCFPEDAVVHVGSGQEFNMIGSAVESLEAGASGTIVIHQGNYNEAVSVDAARSVALLAAGGEVSDWYSDEGPQLTVLDGSVTVDGLHLVGNPVYPGLHVQGGTAWVDRTYIIQNEFGVRVFGANLMMRNSMVGALSALDASAVEIYSSAVSILGSTVVGGDVLLGSAALECSKNSIVLIRNSVVAEYADFSVLCPDAQVSYSATTVPFDGSGNVEVGSVSSGWFVDALSGDFHLSDTGFSLFADIARWQEGDPIIDIDGDARPLIGGEPRPVFDGYPDYAGADVPPI
ncbi:MAG: hypothetical protein AAGF11_38865 [Myxococcota bacterium]